VTKEMQKLGTDASKVKEEMSSRLATRTFQTCRSTSQNFSKDWTWR